MIAGRGVGGGRRSGGRARSSVPEADVEQQDVDGTPRRVSAIASSSEPAVPTTVDPRLRPRGGPPSPPGRPDGRRRRRSGSRSVAGSATVSAPATRGRRGSRRPASAGRRGSPRSARRAAACSSSPKWPACSASPRRVGGDPGAGVVDRQRRARRGRAVADDDRRLAVLDRVGERLLGDPEERQLDVGRRPRAVGALEPDLAAGQPLDPQDEPVEGRPDAEVVEDRQPQVAADRPQPVGRRSARSRRPPRRRPPRAGGRAASAPGARRRGCRPRPAPAPPRSPRRPGRAGACARVASRASGRTVSR